MVLSICIKAYQKVALVNL